MHAFSHNKGTAPKQRMALEHNVRQHYTLSPLQLAYLPLSLPHLPHRLSLLSYSIKLDLADAPEFSPATLPIVNITS